MIDNPDCPVCGGNTWQKIGSTTFTSNQALGAKGWKKAAYRTLFEVWSSDPDTFTVTYQFCRECGFALYTPRPTADEVAASYRIVAEIVRSDNLVAEADVEREALRAHRLFANVCTHLNPIKGSRLLDYGGGDGHLMERFVAAGADCHVIDYSERAAPGVTWAGHTEADLKPDVSYDAILCSHVVEHLVDPLSALTKLIPALKQGGLMYVEVPVEIWKGKPVQSEPVTHLNFFTPASLGTLVSRAGLQVHSLELGSYPHPHGGWRLVAKCIAFNRGAQSAVRVARSSREIQTLLRPSLALSVRRRFLLARDIPHAVSKRLRQLIQAG